VELPTLRRGNVFYYVYKRFFYFCHVFTFFNVFFCFYLNVFFTSMVPVVSAHFRSLRRQFPVWRLVHSTRSELDSGVNSRVGMHVLRSNRAPNDLVSLQPIKSRRWRAWPTHASCNWADLLQVSSVHDIVCCEPTLAPHSQEVFAGSRGGVKPCHPLNQSAPLSIHPVFHVNFKRNTSAVSRLCSVGTCTHTMPRVTELWRALTCHCVEFFAFCRSALKYRQKLQSASHP